MAGCFGNPSDAWLKGRKTARAECLKPRSTGRLAVSGGAAVHSAEGGGCKQVHASLMSLGFYPSSNTRDDASRLLLVPVVPRARQACLLLPAANPTLGSRIQDIVHAPASAQPWREGAYSAHFALS
jgi:hypothetical protein